jgi:RNA polymerase sigma-70 factor (ECF subfamily)
MATGSTRQPGRAAEGSGSATSGCASDAQLLERFIDQREDVAFEELVRRHGAMVMAVCRRVLGNAHDADDAFQATFFVLARKAQSVSPREQVGNFLYGVAYRCSLETRTAIARRRAKEGQAVTPARQADDNVSNPELLALLDREINRLPEKYRLPVVLCELGGKTRREAAEQLGWPEGTVAGRLARARTLLARRMSREGAAVSSVALGSLLAMELAKSALPAANVAAALKAAAVATGQVAAVGAVSAKVVAMAESVLKSLLLAKLKVVTAIVLAVGVIGGGAGVVVYRQHVAAPAANPGDKGNEHSTVN